MSEAAAGIGPNVRFDDDACEPRFYELTFLTEADEVTVGRLSGGPFVVLPIDGARLLQKLQAGYGLASAATWYREEYGEQVDVADFVAGLDELGFVRHAGDVEPEVRIRWMRLGRAVFSPASGCCLAALVAVTCLVMFRSPHLRPSYHQIFFTRYMSIIVLTLFLAQMPLILLHEAAHALAGRRLGLPSRLSLGRRFYYVVFQTTMDGLVTVPRVKRYLPIMAGALTDAGVICALTLGAAALNPADGGPTAVLARFLLALAYMTLLRLIWQCWFFLETDFYQLFITVLGCVNLQMTARQILRNWRNGLLRWPPAHDPASWHPRDRAVGPWYACLILAGYTGSLILLFTNVIPAVITIASNTYQHLSSGGPGSGWRVLDGIALIAMSVGEVLVAIWLKYRERLPVSAEPVEIGQPT